MSKAIKPCLVEEVLAKWASGNCKGEAEEQEIVRALGANYLKRLSDPLVYEAALYDVEVIRDRCPDLPELHIARAVREADQQRDS
jgi:hypothetical protein